MSLCVPSCVCPRVVQKLWGRWRGTEGAEATGAGAGDRGGGSYGDGGGDRGCGSYTGAGDRGCGSYGDTGNRFITTRASMVISKHDMMT